MGLISKNEYKKEGRENEVDNKITQEKNNRLERYQFLVFSKVSENRP